MSTSVSEPGTERENFRGRDLLPGCSSLPGLSGAISIVSRAWRGMPLLLALAGCAAVPPMAESLPAGVLASSHVSDDGAALFPGVLADQERAEPTVIRGSDKVVHLPPAQPSVEMSGEGVTLKFEQASITDVVHAVLGDILKVDYTIHQPVSGEITLHTHRPVPRDQIPGLLDTLMSAHDVAITRDGDGRYHVGRAQTLRAAAPRIERADARATGFGTVIVPLRHIGATEMAAILAPMAPPEALLRVDRVRNLLVLSGSRSQVQGWLDLVKTFDVDLLAGMSVGVFPIEHAGVGEIEQAIRALLGQSGEDAIRAPDAAAQAAGAQARSAEAGGGPLAGLVRILPIERLNSLLVITPRAEYLDKIRVWIERFDQPAATAQGSQLYVYPVQNGSAAHLALVLNALLGGEGSEVAPLAETGIAPGLTATTLTGDRPATLASAGGSTAAMGSSGLQKGLPGLADSKASAAPVTGVRLNAQARVVADEHNNALLIHAPRHEYRTIEAALRRLDVAPTQILIEASIVEVTLTDELKYGLQWYITNALGGGRTGESRLNLNREGDIAPEQPGFSYTITNSAGMVRAVLNMLASKSRVNVISTPSVMVQDNYTATIHVGDQQPVQSARSVSDNGGLTTTSIEYKDTGVMLSVTPSVNAGGMVTMNVNQSVTDVGQIDLATNQRSFMQRQLSTRVAVRSGESIVLGGLIRDNNTRGKQGVPLLHEVPILGNLFGSTAVNANRTELLVMITPRVVQREADHRAALDELRGRMYGLRGLLDEGGASSAGQSAGEASRQPAGVVKEVK